METSHSPEKEASKYNDLHERGVKLNDEGIDFIINSLADGARDAMEFLGEKTNNWPKFNASDNLNEIGYMVGADMLNVPVPYLNKMASVGVPLTEYTQQLYNIEGLETKSIPYPYYLRLAGREETIHHYQKVGNPHLNSKFPPFEEHPNMFSLAILMSDIEVEARKVTDEISVKHGEEPVWRGLDKYLLETYPKYYGKPANELTSIPQINNHMTKVSENSQIK